MKSLVIFATIILSSSAFAGTILPKPSQAKMQQITSAASKEEKCTDFTGTWAGKCLDASGSHDVEVKIAQTGCKFLAVDSTAYAIGGTHQENDAIPQVGGDLFSSVTTHLNWNKEKTVLVSDSDSYLSQTGKGIIYSNAYTGYMGFHEGKLVSNVQGQGVNVSCSLEKR